MNQETLKSTNGKRTAVIERVQGGYLVTLGEVRRLASSLRTRRAQRKPDATALARKWVGR